MWCWWWCQWHHCILSIETIWETWCFWSCDAIGIRITWCHWHWSQHHVMQTALLMEPLHSLGQDDQNEVQYNFFWPCTTIVTGTIWCHHVVPMASSAIAFLRSIHLKWGATIFLVMWHYWHWHHMMLIINGITAFPGLRWFKWDARWQCWSFDNIGNSISVT